MSTHLQKWISINQDNQALQRSRHVQALGPLARYRGGDAAKQELQWFFRSTKKERESAYAWVREGERIVKSLERKCPN